MALDERSRRLSSSSMSRIDSSSLLDLAHNRRPQTSRYSWPGVLVKLSGATLGWVFLGLALTVASFSAFAVPTEPRGASEATYRLQAESLIRDGDLNYDETDRSRFARKAWPDREAKVVVSRQREHLRFHRPLPYSLALAPFVLVAPERGPLLLNLGLLVVLALALCSVLGRDSPRTAPYWTLGLLFGTVVFAYVRPAWPELFVATLLSIAYLLTRDRDLLGELPQLAPRDQRIGHMARWSHLDAVAEKTLERAEIPAALRWLLVGVLLAAAVLQEPLYVVAAVAFLFLRRGSRPELTWAPAVGGFSLVLLAVWFSGASLFPGTAPWIADTGLAVRSGDTLEEIARWTTRLRSVTTPGLVWDPQLTLWNGVYALIGRHLSLLTGFLPLAAITLFGRWVRKPLWMATATIALLALLLDPFNFAGGPEALGFRRLLPMLVVCSFAARGTVGVLPAISSAMLGFVMVSPLWLHPATHPMDLRAGSVIEAVAARLPFESSQRFIPATGEVVSRLLLVRTTNDGVEPGSGEMQFVLKAGKEGELMVASAGPLAHLDLEFGAGAASEIELRGGTVRELLFRPQGGVTFRVVLNEARIRHRVWGRDDIHQIHMLRLSMPGESGRDQPFSVSAEGVAAEGK